MDKKKTSQNVPFASRAELAFCIALGVVNIVLVAILMTFKEINPAITATLATLIYLIEVAIVGALRKKNIAQSPSRDLYELMQESGSSAFKDTKTPTIVLDSYGTILWYNDALHEIIDERGNFIEQNISSIFGYSISVDNFNGTPIEVFGRLYKLEGFKISDEGDGLFITTMQDITEASLIQAKYNDERTAIAYIAIDNVEDVTQYVHEKFLDAVSEVDDKIKNWAASMGGIVKSYDNDKYLMVFDSASLDKCIKDRFSILDEIRNTRVGDGVSITASMGVSRIEGSLYDRESAAREAINLAFQRGGDQVVYKTENATEYYGGKTKSVYKRSNVRSRTFTNQLISMIARADNVIVMGHKYGDFDSFGASVGVCRLAMLCGTKVNIAVDLKDKNLSPCIEMMQGEQQYFRTFVDSAEAMDLISPDTLVVLVDHNSFARAQFSDIAEKVSKVVLIDHHRKSDIMPPTVALHYIEPSASSTCELISEMLENAISSQLLLKEEADIILAGILLDTKQFTRNTGTRTFGAAQYLRGAGANPTDVYDLFKTEPDDLSKEARFHTGITMYRNNIAVSCCDGDTDESYRIIASKAADKMLTLKGVDAAFTLVRIGEQIHISGRSAGKVNVQLILEKLNGGGHFDIAGAQVVSDSILKVLESLKSSIDDYIDSNEN